MTLSARRIYDSLPRYYGQQPWWPGGGCPLAGQCGWDDFSAASARGGHGAVR